ncbi:hypothetical protein GCM10027176_84810 [Actinoallomurus bryophytorum]
MERIDGSANPGSTTSKCAPSEAKTATAFSAATSGSTDAYPSVGLNAIRRSPTSDSAEGLVENSAELGVRLLDGLRKVASAHRVIGGVRGLGLMADAEPDTARRAQQEACGRGLALLTCGAHGNTVR